MSSVLFSEESMCLSVFSLANLMKKNWALLVISVRYIGVIDAINDFKQSFKFSGFFFLSQ